MLDFEAIFAEALAQFRRLLPEFSALTEADPVYKILQLFAARELLLRQRANDKAQQTMLAFATGTNLDHLGALFGVARLVLDPGQPETGVAPTYESDVDFRRWLQRASASLAQRAPTSTTRSARRPMSWTPVPPAPHPGKCWSPFSRALATARLPSHCWTRSQRSSPTTTCAR
ncbi:hypothetical protein XFF6991_480123 [Xanthomonas phaseoli pv. phaseoli]|uniref:Uncharacterized protein n=1 Tax=Xanthomonas campestris pv. phaseoli TaxID=317013 RepID=A0A7Z7J4X3_XANCH|nr:hypothetical protein XFF6991_480123 [Xanthomonas phaseoli pv. phaseoli]